jgi:hypothetical protein
LVLQVLGPTDAVVTIAAWMIDQMLCAGMAMGSHTNICQI